MRPELRPMIELDHLLWAAPDLDDGIAALAAATGITPAIGGAHPGFGTRNALLSLGSASPRDHRA